VNVRLSLRPSVAFGHGVPVTQHPDCIAAKPGLANWMLRNTFSQRPTGFPYRLTAFSRNALRPSQTTRAAYFRSEDHGKFMY